VVQRVAVEPVALQGPARKVKVDSARVVLDRFSYSDVIGLRGIDVLDAVIEEAPLPNDVAAHIHFHDGVGLGSVVRPVRGVAAGGDALRVREVLVGDVQGGVRAEVRL